MIAKNAGKLVNFLLRVGSLLWGLEPPWPPLSCTVAVTPKKDLTASLPTDRQQWWQLNYLKKCSSCASPNSR